ncbi:PREDICTED: vesicle-associated membrane protein 4, partial [Eurypyga helias]
GGVERQTRAQEESFGVKQRSCPTALLSSLAVAFAQVGSLEGSTPLDVLFVPSGFPSSRPSHLRPSDGRKNHVPRIHNGSDFPGGLGLFFFLCLQRNLLEEDSDEEEDFFLRGPSGPRFGPRNDKIRHVQNQVDEVIDVMQENITKVIERGERLDDLQDKSESLSDNATAFSNRAKQLRRQMWWRGCKVKAIIALVAVILLLVIIVPVVLKYHT